MDNDAKGLKEVDIFLHQLTKDINNITARSGGTLGGGKAFEGINGKASMEPPLKTRLGKNTEEAMTQKYLEDIKNGKEVEENNEEINRAIDRLISQMFTAK